MRGLSVPTPSDIKLAATESNIFSKDEYCLILAMPSYFPEILLVYNHFIKPYIVFKHNKICYLIFPEILLAYNHFIRQP